MFTGIIHEIGRVKSATKSCGNLILDIKAPKCALKLDIGASISINGACQTVVFRDREHFKVEAVKETLSRTNIGALESGSLVNLELPLGLGDLLHGHLVQGHVDCLATLTEIKPLDGSTLLSFDYPPQYDKYLIEKGSIAVNGVSLTITRVSQGIFKVSLIPYTINSTTFLGRRIGDEVNVEFDMIAKYIEKLISPPVNNISINFLKEHGF